MNRRLGDLFRYPPCDWSALPNCDFYAFGQDHADLLGHLFALECRVFELSSSFDTELSEFGELSEIERHFQISNWATGCHSPILLQIYPNDARGRVTHRRISLDSNKCDGATFRYKCEGWGLIQLYLHGWVNDELRESHTNHNTEKRAIKWQSTYPESESVADWNWPAITSFSRKLNRFIQSASVAKYGSRPIMESASQFFDLT